MARSRSRNVVRLLVVVVVVAAMVFAIGVTTLELPRDRVTAGTLVVGTSLLVGSLALPALLFAGWRSQTE
ncbi:hypothetical protein [Natrinema sp. 74]|uniref:hypothetical protein n=1 Tax=Natrinema sp. 74 TaxID=3384159 RepID=UPI0038D38102